MDQKHEFGSPSWLQATCDLAERCIAQSGADLTGIVYSFGEELVAIPARLNPAGTERVGWTVQIREGKVTTATLPPAEEADLVNIADWETVEPLCHWTAGKDAELDQRMAQEIERLTAVGKLVRTVRKERPPVLEAALAPLHNEVVAITSPRRVA